MKIKRDDEGVVTVLRLQGKLMGGPEAEEFKTLVKHLVTEGRMHVLVDLGSVSWVNSTGLGILISNYTTLKNAGGTLKLVHTSQRIDQIFNVTKLNTIFESYDDESKALASFPAMTYTPDPAHTVIVLELPSRLELLGVVDKIADGITELLAFEDVDKDAVAISVIEACTNAIQHGHGQDSEQLVRVTFEMNQDALKIRVTDTGPGFNPPREEETTAPDLLATRGRGIFIMRAMMDEVDFDCDGGTTVCLTKRRSTARVEEDPGTP